MPRLCTGSEVTAASTTWTPLVTIDTTVKYYELPFYHAVCYFSGCMTFTLVEEYGNVKISKTTQALLWCLALSCGLGCLFLKLEWNLRGEEASETKRLLVAFIDRILWSVCIAWFWFMCSTSKGGFVNRFLSWNAFVPLARLSFGVYLIHVPFYHLMHRVSRERRFYSHFTLVSNCFIVLVWSYILSYMLAISCEFPTANLDKLAFARDTRKDGATMEEPQKQLQAVEKDAGNIPATSISDSTSNRSLCVA
ncbi:hypothetical protein HPB50_013025 [Hyalomma asiaticum]|uniref:Uncharacterized protein n=1 Tax=Hyalomma asiaticum TaxID=266040 RepID=A0ACB7TH36_HYAAI|nr:hypothetical protein HPB50_013025 [Hyalomma asiaticum]